MWTKVWESIFGLLSVASLLGAAVHGFNWSTAIFNLIWFAIYLLLGIVVALIGIASIGFVSNSRVARRCVPPGGLVAAAFLATTQIGSNSFVLFLAYEAVVLLVALAVFGYFSSMRGTVGTGWIAMGILISILAVLVDAQSNLRFTFYWQFDNHGAFHFVQMLGFALLALGVLRSHEENHVAVNEP